MTDLDVGQDRGSVLPVIGRTCTFKDLDKKQGFHPLHRETGFVILTATQIHGCRRLPARNDHVGMTVPRFTDRTFSYHHVAELGERQWNSICAT